MSLFLLVVGLGFLPARLFVGDPYAWRQEAIQLIRTQELEIPPRIALSHGARNQYFSQNLRTGAWYSKYGVVSGLLNVLPLYVESRLTGQLPDWDSTPRRFYIGLFYVILGAWFGATLFYLAGWYGVSAGAGFAFVLAAVFATFLGFYLRASNSEAYQVLFYTAFFERVAAYRASGFRRRGCLAAAWIYLLALVHVKISHLMVPGIFALGLAGWRVQEGLRGRNLARFLALGIALPGALLLASVAWLNFVKFGSMIGTGYSLWQADSLEHTLGPWAIARNLFFTAQWGIPVHFPLLFLALFGAPEFVRRFPFDAWLAAMVFFAALALIGSMTMWRGEWGYGPRYFLFALPALSLPALLCLDRFLLRAELRKPKTALLATATVLVLSASAFFQFEIARLDPFFSYWVRPSVLWEKDEPLHQFWTTTNFGWVAEECWRLREQPDDLWWMKRLREVASPEVYARERAHLEKWLARTNFYWWSPRD